MTLPLRAAQPLSEAAKHSLTTLQTRWQASIHLHMLSAPLRKCIVTSKILPTSLMVQLKPVTLPSAASPQPSVSSSSRTPGRSRKDRSAVQAGERIVLLPAAILHPAYTPQKPGKGTWITLDPRIYTRMREKGSFKVINPRASVADGMEGLIWWQLGERCVQEVEVLCGRFAGRRRLDLFSHVRDLDGMQSGWAIRVGEGEMGAKNGVGQVFEPKFKDQEQRERFQTSMARLVPGIAGDEATTMADRVYRAKQSHLTAPLGIAMYRLNLWVAHGLPSVPLRATDRTKQAAKEVQTSASASSSSSSEHSKKIKT